MKPFLYFMVKSNLFGHIDWFPLDIWGWWSQHKLLQISSEIMGNTLMVDGEAMTNKDIGFVERRIKSHGLLGKHSTARFSKQVTQLEIKFSPIHWQNVTFRTGDILSLKWFSLPSSTTSNQSEIDHRCFLRQTGTRLPAWKYHRNIGRSLLWRQPFESIWFLLNRGSGAGPGWLV